MFWSNNQAVSNITVLYTRAKFINSLVTLSFVNKTFRKLIKHNKPVTGAK